jgi:hypothetical protein
VFKVANEEVGEQNACGEAAPGERQVSGEAVSAGSKGWRGPLSPAATCPATNERRIGREEMPAIVVGGAATRRENAPLAPILFYRRHGAVN